MDILISRAKRISSNPNTLGGPDEPSPLVTLAQYGGMLAGVTVAASALRNPERIIKFINTHVLDNPPPEINPTEQIDANFREWKSLKQKISKINDRIYENIPPEIKADVDNSFPNQTLDEDPIYTAGILMSRVCINDGKRLESLNNIIENHQFHQKLYGEVFGKQDEKPILLDFLKSKKLMWYLQEVRLNNIAAKLINIDPPSDVINTIPVCSDKNVSKILLFMDKQL